VPVPMTHGRGAVQACGPLRSIGSHASARCERQSHDRTDEQRGEQAGNNESPAAKQGRRRVCTLIEPTSLERAAGPEIRTELGDARAWLCTRSAALWG
jgi:hypothetical protein